MQSMSGRNMVLKTLSTAGPAHLDPCKSKDNFDYQPGSFSCRKTDGHLILIHFLFKKVESGPLEIMVKEELVSANVMGCINTTLELKGLRTNFAPAGASVGARQFRRGLTMQGEGPTLTAPEGG